MQCFHMESSSFQKPVWSLSNAYKCRSHGLNKCVSVHLGCEVKILGVEPTFCEEYVYNPSEKNLTDSMESALNMLK